MSQSESTTIPQLAACVIVGYFILRWFFKSDAPGSSAAASRSVGRPPVSAADRRRLAQQVEVVRGMFPQFSVAAVEAELIRNGGNIEIATERILTNGFLPEVRPRAHVPFDVLSDCVQPPRPTPSPSAASPAPAPAVPGASRPAQANTTAGPSSSVSKGQYPDLITRYSLQSRLSELEPTSTTSSGKGKAPSTKADRQMAHKAKRDEMVLEARRTVEKLIAEGKHEV